jgi:hypothetical protein
MSNENGEVFEAFARSRCEEIIASNKECQILNEQLNIAERELRDTFAPKQLPLFLKYESLIIQLKSTESPLCYRCGHFEK